MSAQRPTPPDLQTLLTQWRDWLSARTDALLSLEERVSSAGTAEDRADLDVAFVVRKSISERLEAVAKLAGRDATGAVALTHEPLRDDLGELVGDDLANAAALLDGVLVKVESSVGTVEKAQLAEVELRARATDDLDVCEQLSSELGLDAGHVADLGARLAARTDLAAVATELATARASLEAAARERTATLEKWSALPARLAALSAQEMSTRSLADRCREKILQAPPLAVPSVAAAVERYDAADEGGELADMPWPAARARMAPVLHTVDRVAAALAEADRRFAAALQRRDDLRGLLEAYSRRATGGGVADIEPGASTYAMARQLLWSAPCDIDQAGALVDRYVVEVQGALAAARAGNDDRKEE